MICKYIADNDNSISFSQWVKIVETSNNVVNSHTIQLEKGFVIIDDEAINEINKWANGEKDIPSLEDSNDILGDIESYDIQEEISFEYFEDCTEDEINEGVIQTNWLWNEHSAKKVTQNIKQYGDYKATMFEGRKGYPSIIWKT